MLSITFGAICSLSYALFVRIKNAIDHQKLYPLAASTILNKHYVDYHLDSTDNISDAIQLALAVKYIHLQANFEIRQWFSNSNRVLWMNYQLINYWGYGGAPRGAALHFL